MSVHQDSRKRLKPMNNAARERSRVQSLRAAFLDLQRSLPSVPPDTKLSKLDVLVLATAYIYHLTRTLDDGGDTGPDTNTTTRRTSTTDQQRLKPNSTSDIPDSDSNSSTYPMGKQRPLVHNTNSSRGSLINPFDEGHSVTNTDYIAVGSQYLKKGRQPSYSSSLFPKAMGLSEESGSHLTLRMSPVSTKSRDKRQLKPKLLTNRDGAVGILHPVKKWPMRYRLYNEILGQEPKESRMDLWREQEPVYQAQ